MKTSPIVLILMLGLVVSVGCAKPDWIQQTLVTVDVTGTWRTTEGGLVELKLTQQGARVTGSILALGATSGASASGPIEGTVEGDVFQFKQVGGALAPFQGEVTVSEDEMRGTVMGGPAPPRRGIVVLRRVSPTPQP